MDHDNLKNQILKRLAAESLTTQGADPAILEPVLQALAQKPGMSRAEIYAMTKSFAEPSDGKTT